MENGTIGKRQPPFVCGKWNMERQTSAYLLQTEMETEVCYLWSANYKCTHLWLNFIPGFWLLRPKKFEYSNDFLPSF
jgi:hypothetical protein